MASVSLIPFAPKSLAYDKPGAFCRNSRLTPPARRSSTPMALTAPSIVGPTMHSAQLVDKVIMIPAANTPRRRRMMSRTGRVRCRPYDPQIGRAPPPVQGRFER
jgi:hypothetical protein